MESSRAVEEFSDTLKNIFKHYCSIGEPLNFTKLKSSKLMKLLKDIQILEQGDYQRKNLTSNMKEIWIHKVDVDLIIAQVLKSAG